MLVTNRYLTWAEDWLREGLPDRLEIWGEPPFRGQPPGKGFQY